MVNPDMPLGIDERKVAAYRLREQLFLGFTHPVMLDPIIWHRRRIIEDSFSVLAWGVPACWLSNSIAVVAS